MASASSIIAGRALVLIEAVDKTGKIFPKVMGRFNKLNKAIEKYEHVGATKIEAIGLALQHAVKPIRNMEISWAALGQFVGYVLNSISRKIKALSASAIALGFQLTLAASSMAIPLADSVKEAAELDTELLKAKAAAELTDEELKSLETTVKRVSEETTFLSKEIAQVAKELARAGLKGENLEAALLPVLNLSRATDYDPARAAEQFVQAVTVFGIGVEGYEKVSDNFVTAANESIVDMDDLGASFSYVAGTAEATRFGLTKTLAALAQLSFSGLTGSKGGTSLNQFLESIGQKSEDIKDAFGIDVFGEGGQLRNPLEILEEMGEVLRSLPDDQKLPHLTRIFNVRGARAVKALKTIENLTVMIDKMNAQMGVASSQAKTLDRGFEGSIRRITKSLSALKIEIGEAFEKPLKRLSIFIEDTSKKITQWIKANQEAVYQTGLYIIASVALGGSLIVLGGILGVTAMIISSIGSALSLLIPLVATLATTFATLFASVSLSTVLPILGAITAGFAAFYAILLLVKDTLYEMGKTLITAYGKSLQTLHTAFQGLVDEAKKLLQVFTPFMKLLLSIPIKTSVYLFIALLKIGTTLLTFQIKLVTQLIWGFRMVIRTALLPMNTILFVIKTTLLGITSIIKGQLLLYRMMWKITKAIVGVFGKLGSISRSILLAPIVWSFQLIWSYLKLTYDKALALWSAIKGFANLVFPFSEALGLVYQMFEKIVSIAQSLWFILAGGTAFNHLIDSMYIIGQTIHDFIIKPLEDLLNLLTEIDDFLRRFTGRDKENETKRKAELQKKLGEGINLSQTVTASSLTTERGTAADVEVSFKDQQQQEELSLWRRMKDELVNIEANQRKKQLGFGGI